MGSPETFGSIDNFGNEGDPNHIENELKQFDELAKQLAKQIEGVDFKKVSPADMDVLGNKIKGILPFMEDTGALLEQGISFSGAHYLVETINHEEDLSRYCF